MENKKKPDMQAGDTVTTFFRYDLIKGSLNADGSIKCVLLPKEKWYSSDVVVESVYENGFSTTFGKYIDFDSEDVDLSTIRRGGALKTTCEPNTPEPKS